MLVSSAKVVKRLEGLLSDMFKARQRSESTDGEHCYQTAIHAYKMAIQVVSCEAYVTRKANPEIGVRHKISLLRRCESALHATKLGHHKRAIDALEKALEENRATHA